MKSLYRIKIIVFGLLIEFLLPVFVYATGSNNLTIVKTINQQSHDINEEPEGSTKVSGAIFRIWRIGDVAENTSQTHYDQILRNLGSRSLSQLDKTYPEPLDKLSKPTNVDGRTSFENLSDGRYYIREVLETENGLVNNEYTIPFIVDLPLVMNGISQSDVTVYPKATEPPPPDEEEPPPPTGGEKFIKVDNKGMSLAGARFKVVDRVRDEQGNYVKDAGGNYIYQSVFLDNREIILVSDGYGRFEISGLPYGVYWLVETASPSGYLLLSQPLEFSITENSYDDAIAIQIVNQEGPPEEPPDTPPGTPPESPPGPPLEPPVTPTPPEVPPEPPKGPIPPIKIPKTGDIEIVLFVVAGIGMVILGAWITKDTQIN